MNRAVAAMWAAALAVGVAGATAPPAGTRAPDVRRPDDQLSIELFGRPLTIGGELATEAGYETGFRLRGADDFGFVVQELALELEYALLDDVSLFVQGLAFYEGLFERDAPRLQGDVELGEAWLRADEIAGTDVGLHVGRQAVWEDRNWWWDDTIDALRLLYDGGALEVEAMVGRDVGRLTLRQDGPSSRRSDAFQALGTAAWRFAGDHWLDGFVVHRDGRLPDSEADDRRRDDGASVDAELTWVGGRLSGEFDLEGRLGELDHLVELAFVGGRERDRRRADDVAGWAVVVEGAWETAWPARPSLTLGYAYGSGDRSRRTRGFRQTGLGSNEGTFGGVEYFDYYGELLEPDLSNLHVWTAALTVRFWRRSSLTLVHHTYAQADAAPLLRGADLLVEPTGRARGIGHAWDAVLGLQEWGKRVEVDLIGSVFRSGPAYGERSGRLAFGLELSVTVNF